MGVISDPSGGNRQDEASCFYIKNAYRIIELMKKILIFFSFLLIFLFITSSVLAEQINDFSSKITINKNGTIAVDETIVYDFGDLQRHGIYRDIPYIKTNKQGKRFRMDFKTISVTDELGKKYRYTTKLEGGKLKIKIGDANRYVTGIKTYIITYNVSGALTYFSDHDELYWNITGNNWSIPILTAQGEILLPGAIPKEQLKFLCYTGAKGSQNQDCFVDYSPQNVKIRATNQLNFYEGLTIVVSFPKNIVAVLEPKEEIDFFQTIWGKLLSLTLVLAGIFWFVIYPIWLPIKWFLHGRDPKASQGEVRAWFDPPKTKNNRPLTPAETSTLIDESVDMRDILATIVDLARRGYFKIVEKKKNDFYFVRRNLDGGGLMTKDKLQSFEAKLLKELFDSKTEIRVKDQELYNTVEEVKTMIYDDMVKEGFFQGNPKKIRSFYSVIAGLSLFTFNFFLLLTALIFGRAMSKRTVFGVEQKNIAKSLFNFLTSQERQLKFQAEKQMFFEKLLPYAVAFGVEKVWAKRFAEINLKQPDWYQGYDQRTFTSIYLANSLNSSFSSFRSAATPTTSSSGFSSGFSGGSSGGGGGGGGGGSW